MIPIGKGPELAVDKGDQLPGEIIRIAADGAGVDVLIAAKAGEAIGKTPRSQVPCADRD